MPAPSWCLILNGKSAGVEAVREAVAAMRGRGVALAVRVTWEAGDAARFVDEALADGVQTLIAGGGDGTVNAVVSALAARPEAADALPSLGVLPLGTANDFATAAQLPIVPHDALALVAEQPPHPVDVLRVAADDAVLWCANLASGGFGTQVTVETRDALKRVLGGLAYFVTGLSRMGRIEPIQVRVHGPEFVWAGGLVALGIGNGRQAGGGQALCPDAWIDDGMIDLTIVPELEGEVVTTLRTALVEGKVAALDQVAVRRRLPRLVVEADAPLTLNLDGEPHASRRFAVECVAGRIRMHLPEDCPLRGAGTVASTGATR
ncbi:lipid kinase YegS [Luteimonas sp. S4-F44]|uniref:lipid kinase YegS n=1 Tax=Luteimonas sp. S4-F44 TaxID=2925842 RepID=UPI001F53340E|nr:lipid kinase YegS [Luteimonas sp. S4-F44]UNK41934.1 lipid kinase YegS [Luteimonas sp. S4-F44]